MKDVLKSIIFPELSDKWSWACDLKTEIHTVDWFKETQNILCYIAMIHNYARSRQSFHKHWTNIYTNGGIYLYLRNYVFICQYSYGQNIYFVVNVSYYKAIFISITI